jgi:hypothetical protein
VTPAIVIAPLTRHHGAGRGVDHDVHQAGRPGSAQPGHQLRRGVLQAEQQQQQHDPDLTGHMTEIVRGAELDEAALTEGDAAEQVQRNG